MVAIGTPSAPASPTERRPLTQGRGYGDAADDYRRPELSLIARLLGWSALILGAARAALGLALAVSQEEIYHPRYLGSSSTGEAIDQGLISMVVGVALILLGRIAKRPQ